MSQLRDVLPEVLFHEIPSHGYVKLLDVMPRMVEKDKTPDQMIANAARVSYAKGTRSVSDDATLIRYLYRHRHTSPFEMVELKFEIKAPIVPVARQLVRHRTACISGDCQILLSDGRWSPIRDIHYNSDTYNCNHLLSEDISRIELEKTYTPIDLLHCINASDILLLYLYQRSININTQDLCIRGLDYVDFLRQQRKNDDSKCENLLCIRMLNENEKKFSSTFVESSTFSGIKHVFKIETENGNKIETSLDHRFFTENGWKTLQEFAQIKIDSKENFAFLDVGKDIDRVFVFENEKATLQKVISITYVGQKGTFDLSVTGPFHNFVCNGFVVHNSWNEQSLRYSEAVDEFYNPGIGDVKVQSKNNKQGSSVPLSEEDSTIFINEMKRLEKHSMNFYQESLNMDVSREMARLPLPGNIYTTWIWKIDLRNFFHTMSLRLASETQDLTRNYCEKMYEMIKSILPISCQAFEDYELNSVNLSRLEIEAIRDKKPIDTKNAREKLEFQAKIEKLGLK